MDQSPVVHASLLGSPVLLHGLIPRLGSTMVTNGKALHSEALSFAVDVAQTQVDVGADALHRLYGERAAEVLSVGPGCGQPEAEPTDDNDTEKDDGEMMIC